MALTSATCIAKMLQKSCTLRLGSTCLASSRLQLLQHFSLPTTQTYSSHKSLYVSKQNIKPPSNIDFPALVYSWKILQFPFFSPLKILLVSLLVAFKENPQRNETHTSQALLDSPSFLLHNSNLLSRSLTHSFLCIMQTVALVIAANSLFFTLEIISPMESSAKSEVYKLTLTLLH